MAPTTVITTEVLKKLASMSDSQLEELASRETSVQHHRATHQGKAFSHVDAFGEILQALKKEQERLRHPEAQKIPEIDYVH